MRCAGDRVFDRQYLEYYGEISPSRRFGEISLGGFIGDDVDFSNSRPGKGGSVKLTSVVRPGQRRGSGVADARSDRGERVEHVVVVRVPGEVSLERLVGFLELVALVGDLDQCEDGGGVFRID